jgi:hypothetical protein
MPIRMRTRISTRGALFTPRGRIIIRHAESEIKEQVAEYAADQVRERLSVVLKHPTGYYESQVRAHAVGSRWQVDDSDVVYGPWLETGKNRRRTKFKGYQTFRKVSYKVEREARRIALRILDRRLREM